LKRYIDDPSVVSEKTRVLLFANFGGIVLVTLLSFKLFFDEDYIHILVNTIVTVVFILSVYFIKQHRHVFATSLSLISLLIFDVFDVVQARQVTNNDMLVYPMSGITLNLLLGFIFIGIVAFKRWQLYSYITFSLALLTTYYVNITLVKESNNLLTESHFIIVDYLVIIAAGSIGVLLNLNLTNRLLKIEHNRTKKLNAYNVNLELLIFERTNALNAKNEELEEKNKILAEQQKRIIKTSKIKEQFLSNVSHELRTPLNAVVGLTDLLIEGKTNGGQNLLTLRHSTNNLLRIINDILDFSKVDNNQFEFISEPFNLHQSLDSIHQVYRANASIKNIAFNYAVSPQLPVELIGDGVRLSQVLANLLSNAIKFTIEGQVDFGCTVVRRSEKKVTIKFTIKDTGIGIAKENQERVFEKFTQLNGAEIAGTGLGLSIVYKMVESLEGEVSLYSELGEGSEFSLLLTYPIHKDSPMIMTDTPVKDLSNKSILIVEDNVINQMVAKQLLSNQNPEIFIANNGEEAYEICKTIRFDAILMDVHMPIMNGFEATLVIRKDGINTNTPIIALTANITEETKNEAISSGMNDFVGKPFKADVLVNKIKSVIKGM
jgi:signal transduction histidine kinase/ActR/RegA family two-component response regulator